MLSKCCTALLVATLFLPSVSAAAPPAPRTTPIANAIAQQARQNPLVLREVQTAPMRHAPGKAPTLLPIVIGAVVGCALGAGAGPSMGDPGPGTVFGAAVTGCVVVAPLGALVGYVIGAR